MSQPAYVDFSERLYITHCARCGMPFGVPDSFDSRLRDNHNTFYCPSGHEQSYKGPSEAEKLKAELGRATQTLDSERQLRAQVEKKLRKVEKRIRNGVCVECHRTFENLARHMESKHKKVA